MGSRESTYRGQAQADERTTVTSVNRLEDHSDVIAECNPGDYRADEPCWAIIKEWGSITPGMPCDLLELVPLPATCLTEQ